MEFYVLYKALKCCAIEDTLLSKLPKAIIPGGQPGAGKLRQQDELCKRNQEAEEKSHKRLDTILKKLYLKALKEQEQT